jgi:hypothetical protein
MIYLGVKLFPESFKVTALSQGFALLGKRYFTVDKYDKIKPWIDSIKIYPRESTRWFFDDKEFNDSQYAECIFDSLNDSNVIYLVNHRALLNITQFFYEWIAQEELYFTPRPDPEFFLASAIRLFNSKQIKSYSLDLVPL